LKYLSSYKHNDFNQNCITGDSDHLYDRLKESILKARKIDIIVAFLMESGVRLLEKDLKSASERGALIRVLCGNYLNITQPQALYLLKSTLEDRVDLRFYSIPNKSFHAKSYIFEYDNDYGDIFVGSSNISRSALTDGIEWNYRINSLKNTEDYRHFRNVFEDLFLNYSIIVDDNEMRRYSRSWRKPKFFEALERLEDTSPDDDREDLLKVAEDKEKYHPVSAQYEDTGKIIKFPRPLGPQIEALYELNKSRLEGWDKGIVVAACGIGKTFLATFDSENFNKVIFIAHREEILSQAEQTFKCVKPEIKTGFFSGIKKESNCDILFATVQTIGRHEYLNENFFKKDEFDYIVVDEFHHAVAGNYRNIINYFKPKFLLGLTATPERLDGQDIFALCDYNLVYEIRLKEAINKGFLVPFRYYGIYDESNYNTVDCKNGRYDEEQLEELLSINKRAELILQHYCKYNSSRALGFCVSRNHAMYMAKYFFLNGIKSCAVISGNVNKNNHRTEMDDSTYIMDRKIAIEKLKNSEIKVIFSVDMFNEGLDVPEVDMVMFLRPTESPTVFLQQLGRGLRKRTGKNYVNILDFIGNYKRANLIPFLLSGDVQHISRRAQEAKLPPEDEYPDDCIVNFDFKLVDLFKDMAEKQKGIFEKVKDEYFRLKEDLGLRPMRLQMYTYIDEYLYSIIRTKKDLNIFRDYFSFLKKVNELTEEENELIGTKAHDFLLEIEKTGMTKTYKMPVLLAFYNNGNIKMSINDEDLYESFKNFYSHGSNYVDLLRHPGSSNYKNWTKKDYVSVARKNPVHFLLQSSPEFFYTDGEKFCLTNSLEKYIDKPAFILHFKDAIDYRTRSFYKERLEKKLLEFEK